MMSKYCNQPDRDVPKLKCGYPLPCPFHTVVVHPGTDRTTLEVPVEANVSETIKARLLDIGDAIGEDEE
jgi:hypothetical protein